MTDEAKQPTSQRARPFDRLDASVQEALIWKDTHIAPSPTTREPRTPGGSSFFISNRKTWHQTQDDPDGWFCEETYPLGNGIFDHHAFSANWYTSTFSSNDDDPAHYLVRPPVTSATPPTAFVDAAAVVLKAQASEGKTPKLAIFVHGVGTLFGDAVAGTATFGAKLRKHGRYEGLVIGFDWPSFDGIWSGIDYSPLPYSFPPAKDRGSTRGNVNGSVTAFSSMLAFVQDVVAQVPGTQTSLICHSEGNYMAMLGLNASTTKHFDHIVLLAPDINSGALLSPAVRSDHAGQGAGICDSAGDVTVYWTNDDGVLSMSQRFLKKHHNPQYPDRLGYAGCSGAQADQSSNVYSVDCSDVLTEDHIKTWVSNHIIPKRSDVGSETHISYLYVPQVLRDVASVLNGTSQSKIQDRRQAASSRWFEMVYEHASSGGT